jgi:hypothetical protein
LKSPVAELSQKFEEPKQPVVEESSSVGFSTKVEQIKKKQQEELVQ